MAIRRIGESVVGRGWIALQEARVDLDRNMLVVMLTRELCAALELFGREGLAPCLSR